LQKLTAEEMMAQEISDNEMQERLMWE